MPRNTDSHQIRDALQEKDVSLLKDSITKLATDVQEGFKGVHARQDVANGRTGKLENWQAFMKGGLAVLTLLLVPILIYMVTHFYK